MEDVQGFITSFRYFSESIAPLQDIRNLHVERFDDGDISEDEFIRLYDANTWKNPDFRFKTAMDRST